MSEDKFSKIDRYRGAAPHMYGGLDLYSHQKIGNDLTIKSSQVGSIRRDFQRLVYNTTSSPSTAMTSGDFSDFNINLQQDLVCNDLWLKLNWLNSTGAAATISPSPLQIDRVQFYQDGSSLLQEIRGEDIWLALNDLDQHTFDQYLQVMNTSSTYGIGASVANGDTAEYWVPLLGAFLANDIYLHQLRGNMIVRVYWRGSQCVEVGSLPTLTAAQLYIYGYKPGPSDKAMLNQRYQNNALDFRVLQNRRAINQLTIAASSTYNLRLDGVTGLVAYMEFLVENPTRSGANLRQTLDYLASLELKYAGGASMQNNHAYTANEMFNIIRAKKHRGDLAQNQRVWTVGFGDSVSAMVERGWADGGCVFTGDESVEVVSNASATGSVNITCYYKVYSIIRIKDGKCSVHIA